MSKEEEIIDDQNPMLTPPISIDGGTVSDYRAPNFIQQALSLFKNVQLGSDLTHFQLPPLFNLPKSQLQLYGESVYCISDDLLSKCANGKSSLDRFIAVVSWTISTMRPALFGVAPLNPILGETHHVSRGSLNVLLEQVSHHPPVTALHATDEKENLEMVWCQHPVPKFYGTKVEATLYGKRQLKLLNHGENYAIGSPTLLVRILPRAGTDWIGNIKIQCEESGLEAELCCSSHAWFGGNHRSVKGRIFDSSSSSKTIYEIDGHWDRTVIAKDMDRGTVMDIYNANKAISNLKTPIVKDLMGLRPSESVIVWSEVNQSILNKEWEKAREAKNYVEDKQREQRKSREETWVPRHFNVSCTKNGGWECSPKQKWVPSAPIVVPL